MKMVQLCTSKAVDDRTTIQAGCRQQIAEIFPQKPLMWEKHGEVFRKDNTH
jgi:hypothetical protein